MPSQARYIIRIDDINSNAITRTLRSEPHVIDESTEASKEYAITINSGVMKILEQDTPTTQIASDISFAVGGRDMLRYSFFLSC